jgi:membrane fusion protein (multidrug efflux system)
MAAARDQAARILRPEPETADGETARDASAALADQLRSHLTEETARRPAEAERPAVDKPATAPSAPAAAVASAAPKSRRRRLVLIGIGTLLALAAAAYGVHYILVGRFLVSTDDAYVRANSTTLGARVSGHIATIFPGDNAVVRAGDVIFRPPPWKARSSRPRRRWFRRRPA